MTPPGARKRLMQSPMHYSAQGAPTSKPFQERARTDKPPCPPNDRLYLRPRARRLSSLSCLPLPFCLALRPSLPPTALSCRTIQEHRLREMPDRATQITNQAGGRLVESAPASVTQGSPPHNSGRPPSRQQFLEKDPFSRGALCRTSLSRTPRHRLAHRCFETQSCTARLAHCDTISVTVTMRQIRDPCRPTHRDKISPIAQMRQRRDARPQPSPRLNPPPPSPAGSAPPAGRRGSLAPPPPPSPSARSAWPRGCSRCSGAAG
jgi:hypothetical protein